MCILWFSLTSTCSGRPLSSDSAPVSGLPVGFPVVKVAPVPVFSGTFKEFLKIFCPEFIIIITAEA